MASANLEAAKNGYAAIQETYRRGDLSAVTRLFAEMVHPGFVLTAEAEMFTEGEWRGPAGLLGFVANQMEALEEMWLKPEEFIEVGDDAVVVPITFGGRARHTGIQVELTPVHVCRFRDGKLAVLDMYRARADALASVGVAVEEGLP